MADLQVSRLCYESHDLTTYLMLLISLLLQLDCREICDELGIAAYTIDDIDKVGIGEVIQKALESINPR